VNGYGFKNTIDYNCIGYMIVSEVRMFLKEMNKTNALILVNFVLENTHKYHENYSINILKL
jgi:hypothetical protein